MSSRLFSWLVHLLSAQKLSTLKCRRNDIGDIGAQSLMGLMTTYASLTSITLGDQVGPEGARDLAKFLQDNNRIRHVNLLCDMTVMSSAHDSYREASDELVSLLQSETTVLESLRWSMPVPLPGLHEQSDGVAWPVAPTYKINMGLRLHNKLIEFSISLKTPNKLVEFDSKSYLQLGDRIGCRRAMCLATGETDTGLTRPDTATDVWIDASELHLSNAVPLGEGHFAVALRCPFGKDGAQEVCVKQFKAHSQASKEVVAQEVYMQIRCERCWHHDCKRYWSFSPRSLLLYACCMGCPTVNFA
jgi:hypothetical protein